VNTEVVDLSALIPSIITRARVPRDVDDVVSLGSEVDADEVGADLAGVESVWDAVRNLYRSGIHPAIQLCVRRRGAVILDRAIGYASGAGPGDHDDEPRILATPETPFNMFSAAKAVTAMVVHLLDQRHLIHLDDPICEYIPEFGCHGKQWITIRHVLTHRAGIPNFPPEAMNLDLLSKPDIVEMICEGRPVWRPGRRVAYHAIVGGFLLGEIVRRVTGTSIRTVLDHEICGPMGFRWMNYGVNPLDVGRVARNYFTGPPVLPPVSLMLRRALGVDFQRVTELSNDPRFLTAVIPAGNIIATARELSRFYELLLGGGQVGDVRIFESRTVRRATSEQSYLEFDLTLGLPLRYGMGFMLGGRWFSLYGPDTEHAFGHIGFTNVIGWADPARQIAAALMTSGKPLLYPEIYYVFEILRRIARACPKESVIPGPAAMRSRRAAMGNGDAARAGSPL
jgi:CubicO group peptidase (beta-lactamase class C family)